MFWFCKGKAGCEVVRRLVESEMCIGVSGDSAGRVVMVMQMMIVACVCVC